MGPPAPIPRAVGRYLVLREEVHDGPERRLLAYDPELDRRVLLRILAAEDPAAPMLLAEARLLGRLRHPHILSVRDSGVCPEGLYVALEHAGEETLADWLAAERRPLPELLHRFLLIGDALAAAHGAGLGHGAFSAAAVVLGKDGAPRLGGLRVEGPGQEDVPGGAARGDGAPAETRRQALARSDARAFCFALESALSAVSAPAALRRLLRRGKAPEGAALPAILAELRRLARPAWVRRGPLVAAVLLLAVLLGGRQWRAARCGGAERHLVGLWDEAQRGKVRQAFLGSGHPGAEAALRRVEESLAAFLPRWAAEHRAVCEDAHRAGGESGELLELRMGCLQRSLLELRTMAEILASADRRVVERAAVVTQELTDLSSCRDGAQLRTWRIPQDPARRPEVAAARAALVRPRVLLNAGKRREAEQAAIVALQQAESAAFAPVIVEALLQLGQVELARRDARAAERQLLRAVALAEGSRHDGTIVVLLEMLMQTAAQRAAPAAEQEDYARWAAATLRRCDGCESLWPNWHRKMGNFFLACGRYDEAVAEYQQALGRYNAPGAGDLDIHANLGQAYLRGGHLEPALVSLRRSLQLREQRFGPGSPSLNTVLDGLVEAMDRQGRFDEALRLAEREVAISEPLGADSVELGAALFSRGRARFRLGRAGEGLRDVRQGATIVERALGPTHPDLTPMLTTQAELTLALGRTEEAEGLLGRGLAIATARQHPDQVPALVLLGRVREAQGDRAAAKALWRQALGMAARWPLPQAVEGALCLGLGEALLVERPAEARALLERARARFATLGRAYEGEQARAEARLRAASRDLR